LVDSKLEEKSMRVYVSIFVIQTTRRSPNLENSCIAPNSRLQMGQRLALIQLKREKSHECHASEIEISELYIVQSQASSLPRRKLERTHRGHMELKLEVSEKKNKHTRAHNCLNDIFGDDRRVEHGKSHKVVLR
jgi:hypothetical protein